MRRLSRERYAETRKEVEGKIAKWVASARTGKVSAKAVEKAKEKEGEELKKARKRGMSLADYRKWRDRELWTNEFNALRKKTTLGDALSDDERAKWIELEQKLTASGGIPPPGKAIQQVTDVKQSPSSTKVSEGKK